MFLINEIYVYEIFFKFHFLYRLYICVIWPFSIVEVTLRDYNWRVLKTVLFASKYVRVLIYYNICTSVCLFSKRDWFINISRMADFVSF